MAKFHVQFPLSQLRALADNYRYRTKHPMEREIGPRVRARGFYTKEDFVDVGLWKSPRNERHYRSNDDDFVQAVTSAAFSTTNEQLRIEILTLLRGVNWPTASTLLHFGSTDRFPILDFRALWSLGRKVPKNAAGFYNFELWWEYTLFCRKLADECGVSMRELDKALWQFSKENQTVTADEE